MSYVEEYAAHGKTVASAGKESGAQVTSVSTALSFEIHPRPNLLCVQDPAVKQATNELRTVLERFANNKSMEPIFDAVNTLINDARTDEGLRDWFKNVDTFVRKVGHSPRSTSFVSH